MSKDHIFIEEEQNLKQTLDVVSENREALEKAIEKMGGVNLDTLRGLREDTESGMDLLIAVQKLHEKNLAFNLPDKYKRVEELRESQKEPYFSRIDLKDPESEATKSLYIGKFGVMGDKEPIVTDWRAKAASVYYKYRYPQKNVEYQTPAGKVVRDLTLKRTFEIDNGELIKYYNNDIQLDEDEIIIDKISDRTGGVLEDIVETIQESQLEIIESDPRQITIVQGCVGSGKSTVAIHKLSHIFFNFPDLIHAERSILIAKNQILVSYLSTLFPKLGIFDINFKTIKDLLIRLKYAEEVKVDFDFTKKDPVGEFGIVKIEKLKNIISKIHSRYGKKLESIFDKEEFAPFAGFVYNEKVSVQENITEILKDMNEELSMQKEYLKETSSALRKERYKENIKILKKITARIRSVNQELNNKLFPSLEKQFGVRSNKSLSYKESLIFLALYLEIYGVKKFTKFEYCVVDEGQDFTPLEYLILGKLVLNGRFCILGDLNQSYSKGGLNSWEQISRVIFEASKASVFELDTNYRSTKQIIDFANEILKPYTKSYLPKPIKRMGEVPKVKKFSSEEEMLKEFHLKIVEDAKELDKSIGVICASSNIQQKALNIVNHLGLDHDKIIELDPDKEITYEPKAIYVTHIDEVKGLEFAKVYVLGLDLDKVSTFKEAKRAFVTVTRAMNELEVLSSS